jgi:putative flippase GtrA
MFRYFFVGGAAAAVDIGVFTAAVKGYQFDWFFIALFSFSLATVVNYALSIRYVFESGIRFKKHAEISLVFLVSGIGMLINQSVLFVLIEAVNLEEVLSKVIATGGVFLWNYTARSRYIFKSLQ